MAVNPSASSILVTGMGACGAGSANCAELWEHCVRGRGVAAMQMVSGKEVPVYRAPDPALNRWDAHLVRVAGRAATLAMAAAREAWQHAGLEDGRYDATRVGVVIGSSRGPADIVDASAAREIKRPSEAVYTAFSSAPGILASAFGVQGCALAVSATCTSGAAAIQTGRQMLRSGDFDIVLAGGADAPLIDSILQRMHSTGTLSASRQCSNALKPFDVNRDGTVLGEGAAFLILETAASAARRGAAAHGTLLGAAITCEPHSRTRPSKDCEGLQRAVRAALGQRADLSAAVDLLHLHGTGTAVNDLEESACVNALYPAPSSQPVIWATKGITGHTLGAASAFQAVLTLLAMRHSFLPGTANCNELDPACRMRLSMGSGSPRKIESALCLTSGFWGKSSCLYFGAPGAA
jgi:3-oxoacyl-[acyl-carrier-protein] synthase II